MSDYYIQLSVQILRICEKRREYNGGMMKIEEVMRIYNANYPSNQISFQDVIQSVNTIAKLGTGCSIVNNKYISTVPFELSNDQLLLLKYAEGVVSKVDWSERIREQSDR